MKRHRFDPYSFVFGLSFVGLGAVLLNTEVDLADVAGAGWLPLPAFFAGLLLLAFGLDRVRSAAPENPPGVEPPEDESAQT